MIFRWVLPTIGAWLVCAGLGRIVLALTDDPSARTGIFMASIGVGIAFGMLAERRSSR